MNHPAVAYIKKSNESIIKRGGTGSKLEVVIMVLEGAWKLFSWAKNFYREKFSYHVTVSEKQAVYGEVNKWLLDVLPSDKNRTISVYSSNNSNMVSPEDDGGPVYIDPLILKFNDRAARSVLIEGHKVEVRLKSPDVTDAKFYERMEIHDEITFSMYSHEAQKAVIRHLEALNQKRVVSRKAVLKMTTTWGDWRTRSDLPPRTMDSVNIPEDQKDRLIKDVGEFLESEGRYNELAIPFHRGYMFHGPPGTGKTSLAKALANHFNLDMWYISLSDLNSESSLMGLIGRVGPRSILLLEDIDTVQVTHDRDSAEQGKMTTASLLNALDGVATPHGLITIMTTNRFDILDPALTRAGRMDVIEMIDYPDLDTVSEMYEHFYQQRPGWVGLEDDDFKTRKISTSQIAEIMKRNLKDPQQSISDIQEMVKNTEIKE